MNETRLRELVTQLRSGDVTEADVMEALRRFPYQELGFAKLDHHRHARQGMPEAVYAPGKRPEHCAAIVGELLANGTGPVILSRADAPQMEACSVHPGSSRIGHTLWWRAAPERAGTVAVVTAGTADLSVAEETVAVLAAHGAQALLIADCGVAGIHRLFDHLDDIRSADVIVAVAGMEGALASVLGGLVSQPIVALPTSVGYGSSMEGVTAMLAMLASCAPGISVVGIDNGYGAACAAVRILATRDRPSSSTPPSVEAIGTTS